MCVLHCLLWLNLLVKSIPIGDSSVFCVEFAREHNTNGFYVCFCSSSPCSQRGILGARVQESGLCGPVHAGLVRWSSYRAEASGIHYPGQMGRDSFASEVAE